MARTKYMLSKPLSLLFVAVLALSTTLVSADDKDGASRVDILERRIEALERMIKAQQESLEDVTRRNLQFIDTRCLPKRSIDGVCVYDDKVEVKFQEANIVFDSSTVKFTGPIREFNATDSQGIVTNLTDYAFSSKMIFDATDVVVENSNFSFTAEHDYTDFDANKTNVTQYYGFFNINNTNVALNSSDFVVTGPNPREVDKSLYDDHTYADLFPSMKFSYVDISVKDSNTTYTAHPYSTSDNSNINFINMKLSHEFTDISTKDSITSVSDSSVSYGRNTNVQWYGNTASAQFTNGVEVSVDSSRVYFDDTDFEMTGSQGRLLSHVDTHIRGPDSGDAIEFLMTRRVNARFEQESTMRIQADVDISSDFEFEQGSELKINGGSALVIDGRFRSNDESEFRGDIQMTNVNLDIEGELIIDGSDGDDDADIDFRGGVEVRFSNHVRMDRDLNVAGEATLDSLEVQDEATMRGRLYARRGATISGDTDSFSGSTSAYSPELLKVEGSALLERDLEVGRTFKADSTSFDSLDISGMATVRNLEVTGAAKLYSLTMGSGTANLRNIDVSGTATVRSLSVDTNANVGGNLAVTGSTELDNTVFFDVDVLGDLGVVGSFRANTAAITGESRVGSILVDNNAVVRGDLTVDGTSKLDDISFLDLDVSGVLKATEVEVSRNLEVDGTILGRDSATFDAVTVQRLDVSQDASVQTLEVNRNADIGANLVVGGSTSFQTTVFQDIEIQGKATVRGDFTADKSVSLSERGGKTSIGGDMAISGQINAKRIIVQQRGQFRTLSVLGNATIRENLRAGNTTLAATNVNGDLNVFGSINEFAPAKKDDAWSYVDDDDYDFSRWDDFRH